MNQSPKLAPDSGFDTLKSALTKWESEEEQKAAENSLSSRIGDFLNGRAIPAVGVAIATTAALYFFSRWIASNSKIENATEPNRGRVAL